MAAQTLGEVGNAGSILDDAQVANANIAINMNRLAAVSAPVAMNAGGLAALAALAGIKDDQATVEAIIVKTSLVS
jgi:hypothetical protein